MTPHELLMPRYIVIADYIGNTQPIGYIFKSDIGEYYDRFPANFRKLHWSEYREVSDMPEYVKDNHGVVMKIKEYDFSDNTIYTAEGPFTLKSFLKGRYPATHEEYIQYQQTKVK